MYVTPLTNADPPIIPHDRLQSFLNDVYHNYRDLLQIHRQLVNRLHEIQREEHPLIRSVTAPLLDAAFNFRDAYMEYIPNSPISHYRIDEEMQNNPAFKAFADVGYLKFAIHKLLTISFTVDCQTPGVPPIRHEELRS